jgi:signal transduction histidine kinase
MSQRVWTLGEIDRGHLLASDVEKVSAYEVIAECRKTLNDLAEQREIKIILDPLLKNWPPLWVNKALFHQTVLNLVDNAIKYSRDNTEIRIDGKRSTEGYTLYFVNRGILIREDDKNQIFSRYFRTNEAKSYRQQGTGIGLYIVKVFADKYGDIKVKSLPIPGSRDYVTTFELFIREREH